MVEAGHGRLMQADSAAIAHAGAVLRGGGLVGLPTETVYGLAADATNPVAVAGIFEAKGRPRFNPLIVHVAEGGEARTLVMAWPEAARRLAGVFWPGPLTLVLPRTSRVPDIVTAGLPGVAVRCPDHDVARSVIRAAGRPIAAPSANRSTGVSPTTARHVAEEVGAHVALILDAGPCRCGIESTVLSLMGDRPRLLRPGALPVEAIEAVIGAVGYGAHDTNIESPGMMKRHYAPATPTRWRTPGDTPAAGRRIGLLTLRDGAAAGFAVVEVLSASGDLREAAANLFAALRRMDAAGLDEIRVEAVREEGLGRAINDRLRRAVAE